MTDKASSVLNGGGGGGSTAASAVVMSQPADVVDGWKRVAQINMKAREQVWCGVVFRGDMHIVKPTCGCNMYPVLV